MDKKHTYSLKTLNGRVKVYIDGLVMVSFEQLAFKGYYSSKEDTNTYLIQIYLNEGVTIECYFKTKEVWIQILKLLDQEL